MQLRDYQIECLEILKQHDTQLIQLPTGSGKTTIFLTHLRNNSNKALIVVPTLDLQEQIYESALNLYHPSEIYCKTQYTNFQNARVYILVANSLNFEKTRDYFKDIKLDHIIFDEAHRALSNTYVNFLDFYSKFYKSYKLIGFTATPERLDRKCLLTLFGKITYKKNIFDLIKEGYLCNVRCFQIKTKHDLKSDSKSADFKMIEIGKLDTYSRNHLIYKTYEENCFNKKTLIFCISIDHAEKIANYLRQEKGVRAYHISGVQSTQHRKELLAKFKSGQIQVLTNCQLLTEGFDEPSIEAIIISRPTRSKSLYCQMIGRGTRLHLAKNICDVYELTDNNHKICTFNVAADEEKDERFQRPYRDGITLTELKKEISEISLKDFILEKHEICLVSDFRSFLESKGVLDSQKKKLDESNFPFLDEINVLQASFLIFLQNLRVKYGYN